MKKSILILFAFVAANVLVVGTIFRLTKCKPWSTNIDCVNASGVLDNATFERDHYCRGLRGYHVISEDSIYHGASLMDGEFITRKELDSIHSEINRKYGAK